MLSLIQCQLKVGGKIMVNTENVKRLWNEAQEKYSDFETAYIISAVLFRQIQSADEITEELIECIEKEFLGSVVPESTAVELLEKYDEIIEENEE